MIALPQASLPRMTQPLIVTIALLYFAIVAVIATWATRKTKTERDFFVAGAGVGLWTLAIAKMAASLSGFSFVGGPGLVYTIGLAGVFIILPGALSNALGAWVLAKKMRLLGEARPDGYWNQPKSHNAVAAAIAQARADWGMTIAPVARASGLGFIPLAEEHYDFALVTARKQCPAVQAFLDALAAGESRAALELAGFRPA